MYKRQTPTLDTKGITTTRASTARRFLRLCTVPAITSPPCVKRNQVRRNVTCVFLFGPDFASAARVDFRHPKASRAFDRKPHDTPLTARRILLPPGSCARLTMLPPPDFPSRITRAVSWICLCFLPVVSTLLPLSSARDTHPLCGVVLAVSGACLLYTSPSPRD